MLEVQNKERILKASREKRQIIHKCKPIRIRAVFSEETLKAKKAWTDVFQTLQQIIANKLHYVQQSYPLKS
jgi:hypothetical protein